MATKKPDPEPRAAMTTQRISLEDLEKLKQQSRALDGVSRPLPNLDGLFALLGASLDDAAVADLGLKEKTSGAETSASSKALGIELMARGRRVESVFLHSQNHEGFHAWPGDLGGISFTSTPTELKRLFGAPTRASTGWDRWDQSRGSLHVQYGGNGVQLVTLMAPGTAP